MTSLKDSKVLLSQRPSMYILVLIIFLAIFGPSAAGQATVAPSSTPHIYSPISATTSLPPSCTTIKCLRRLARRRLKRADPAAPAVTAVHHVSVSNSGHAPAPVGANSLTQQKAHPNPAPAKAVEATPTGAPPNESPKSSASHDFAHTTANKGTASDRKVTKAQSKTEQQHPGGGGEANSTSTSSTATTDNQPDDSSSQEGSPLTKPKILITIIAAAIGGILACSLCIFGIRRVMRRHYGSSASSAPTCSYSETSNATAAATATPAAAAAAAEGKTGKNRQRITSLKNIGAPMATSSTSSSGPLLTEFWDIPSEAPSKSFKSRISKKVAPDMGPLPKSLSILRDKHRSTRSTRSRPSWAISCISKASTAVDYDAPPVPALPIVVGTERPTTTVLNQPSQAKKKLRVNVAQLHQDASGEYREREQSPVSPALSLASTSYSVTIQGPSKAKRIAKATPVPLMKIDTVNLRSGSKEASSPTPPLPSSTTCVHFPSSIFPVAPKIPSPEESAMAKASWLSEDEGGTGDIPIVTKKKKKVPLYEPLPRETSPSNARIPRDNQPERSNDQRVLCTSERSQSPVETLACAREGVRVYPSRSHSHQNENASEQQHPSPNTVKNNRDPSHSQCRPSMVRLPSHQNHEQQAHACSQQYPPQHQRNMHHQQPYSEHLHHSGQQLPHHPSHPSPLYQHQYQQAPYQQYDPNLGHRPYGFT